MTIVGIIPARMASTRLPGKPLASILGMTMIEHVYRRAMMTRSLNAVYVATPDKEIIDAVKGFGGQAILTSSHHLRGTDRVAEAAATLQADIVANIQGDEPLISPALLDQLIMPLAKDPALEATNLMAPIRTPEELISPHIVKVACDRNQNALYFSRQPIPTQKAGGLVQTFRQLGLYAFRKDRLIQYAALPPGPLEEMESVDMLRFLENGLSLRMICCDQPTQGVDTEADRRQAERAMETDPLWPRYRAQKVPQ